MSGTGVPLRRSLKTTGSSNPPVTSCVAAMNPPADTVSGQLPPAESRWTVSPASNQAMKGRCVPAIAQIVLHILG